MAEYIERRAAMREIAHARTLNSAYLHVATIPAADVVEVVHGKWVDHCVRDWRCSECGEKINKVRNVDGYCYDDKPNYCPNCGARMDGDNP